jgi:hypothetical protein
MKSREDKMGGALSRYGRGEKYVKIFDHKI